MPSQDSQVLGILREVDGLLENRLRSLPLPTNDELKDLARDVVQLRSIMGTVIQSFDCYLTESERRDTESDSDAGVSPPEFALDFNYEVVCRRIEAGREPGSETSIALLPTGFRTSSPADSGGSH